MLFAAYGVTEPNAGSDVAALQATTVRKRDHCVINVEKMWITNVGKTKWGFVLAKTDPSAGNQGMTGVIVDADAPGITLGRKEWNIGRRTSDTRGVKFKDVVVPVENQLSEGEQGFEIAMKAFEMTLPLVTVYAFGLAR